MRKIGHVYVNVDPAVYALAESFIEDSAVPITPTTIMNLAQHMQDAIEAWFDVNEPKGVTNNEVVHG